MKKIYSIYEKYPNLEKHYSSKNEVDFRTEQSFGHKFYWNCVRCKIPFQRKIHGVRGKNARILCESCRYISVREKHQENSRNKYGTLAILSKKQLAIFDILKNNKTPSEINANSKEKIYLKCKYGHETSRGAAAFFKQPVCIYCSRQTSHLELRIFCEFHAYFSDIIWQHKHNEIELDIFIPSLNFAIEIDGERWHKDLKKDLKKNAWALKNGITLFRYRAGSLEKIENGFQTTKKSIDVESFAQFCSFLVDKCSNKEIKKFANWWLEKPVFKNDKYFLSLLARLPSPPIGQSLGDKRPDLIEQWSSKNDPLTIFDLWPSSGLKVFWKCINSPLHDDFKMRPRHKIEGKGCPACANRKLAANNSLAHLKPKISKMWHPKKNYPNTPSDVLAGSTKKYWWQCDHGHEWQDALAWWHEEKINQRGCQTCKSLSFLFPDLAKEWHPKKNLVSADKVNAYTNSLAWWICQRCGHTFKMLVSNRTHKTKPQDCPKHSHEKRLNTIRKKIPIQNSFSYQKPVPCRQWDFSRNKIQPHQVYAQSNKRYFFICVCGRSITRKAVNCDGEKKITCRCIQTNSLMAKFPLLAKEWHPTKNGDLTPETTTIGSNKKVWWLCSKNSLHLFEQIITHRTLKGYGCKICSSNWDERYNELKATKSLMNKDITKKEQKKINMWAYRQRKRKRWLLDYQISLLESLPDWSWQETKN